MHALLNNWRNLHCRTGITFGTRGQNAMKKAVKFYPVIFQFSCDQIIKTIGLLLRLNMFGAAVVLFSSVPKLVNIFMCKKPNELIKCLLKVSMEC